MRALLRLSTMFVLAIGLGAASASYQQFGWFPDAEAVRVRLERKRQIAARDLRRTLAIDLAGFRAALERGAAVIDARDPEAFAAGHVRLEREPPTLNIFPDHGLDAHFERLHQLGGMELLIYCNSETCELAEELYVLMEQAGLIDQFAGVSIFFEGWEALEDTDIPRATGPDEWVGQAFEGMSDDSGGELDGDAAGGDEMGEEGLTPSADETEEPQP